MKNQCLRLDSLVLLQFNIQNRHETLDEKKHEIFFIAIELFKKFLLETILDALMHILIVKN